MLDLSIVLMYLVIIMVLALRGKKASQMSSEEYFMSSRSLKWYSVAISTIATNVQGYQFLGMMGSAYLYGLAQANLEIDAMQGIFLAAFLFVPLYLKNRIITITQFLKAKLGSKLALFYTTSNMLIFSTVGLGAALFWGAYAAELVFSEELSFIHGDRMIRVSILLVLLGVFSATYTYFGGLTAVVRTDIYQFSILVIGGCILLYYSMSAIGGFDQLYIQRADMMHLHLPADHSKLPWTLIGGLFFLNINYWCANQSVMQRSLAAKSLAHAQAGLLVGGLMKYFMAILIIVPGIALAIILKDNPLSDPDETFPYLVNQYLSPGVKGIIVCALFASLMSTVDSTFNSLATLFTVDIYQAYINPSASDAQLVSTGRNVILVTLCTGVIVGILLLMVKFGNPQDAFTHTLNEIRYYVNCGIVVLICTAALLIAPDRRIVIVAFLLTIPLQLVLKQYLPDMNYFVRAGWVICIPLGIIFSSIFIKGSVRPIQEWFVFANKKMKYAGALAIISLLLLHIVFH